ncbi:uncharacterized protein LOC134183025 isoform X2 [Corticium candelabrum]|uniref:uncharacterized protein LOC134183025 isoform X2 n=1 Tax=Corticium candelabrum TaxID=121492 RepID=UPI002E2702F4|nr:uncharacterized protein LOC134183025 isoform X2 [Corticium candelabrum]
MSKTDVLKEGTFHKFPTSGRRGRTKKRLFQLTNSQLSYYTIEAKTKKAPLEKGRIPLVDIVTVERISYDGAQEKFAFCVLFTELNITKKLTMLGSSDKEVQDWMQAIEAAKKRLSESQAKTNSLRREGFLDTTSASIEELELKDQETEGEEEEETWLSSTLDKEPVVVDQADDENKHDQQKIADEEVTTSDALSLSDSSPSLAASVVSGTSFLSSSSGVSSAYSGRNSASFEPPIEESEFAAMETAGSKGTGDDAGDDAQLPRDNGNKVMRVLSNVPEEVLPTSEENEGNVEVLSMPEGNDNSTDVDVDLTVSLELQEISSPGEPVQQETEMCSPVSSRTLGRMKRGSGACLYHETNVLDVLTDGQTLLHVACQQGNISKVKELLDGGANWSICDTKKHQPCLFHAYIHDHKEVLEVLLDHGCDPDIEEQRHGTRLLHQCAQKGDTITAECLLKHNAQIDALDYHDKTSLRVACESSKFSMVELLLDGGANVNQFGNGQTCLHIAGARGDQELVELLLRHGANVLSKDQSEQRTPYDLAVSNKHDQVAEMLRAAQPEELRAYGHTHSLKGHNADVSALAYSGMGYVATGDGNGMIIIWDPVEGKQLHSLRLDNAVLCISFWNSCMIVSTEVVTVYDLERIGWKLELNTRGSVSEEDRPLQLVAVSPDGLLAVVDIDSNQIELWSTGSVDGFVRRPIRTIVADSVLGDKDGVCHSLAFSPDVANPLLAASIQPGSRLSPEGNNLIHLYNWQTGKFKRVIDVGSSSDASDVCMVFSPFGRYLSAGTCHGVVLVWEMSGVHRLLHRLVTADGCAVNSVAISADGTQLAAACDSGTIQVFDVRNGASLFTLTEHQKSVRALCYSPSGCFFISTSDDKTVKVWKVSDRETVMPSADCDVQPSYPPSRAVTATGNLTELSHCFWEQEFERFDEDRDGMLKHSEFNKFYLEYMDEHILPDDFTGLLRRRSLSSDSGVTRDVLYQIVAQQFLNDCEGMWKKWTDHGLTVDVIYC